VGLGMEAKIRLDSAGFLQLGHRFSTGFERGLSLTMAPGFFGVIGRLTADLGP
jgi:hypothetical protein